ncbi:MAG: hypothetical protein J6J11_06415 [Treponema sp.]|nr:hypothetical protein [Clostridia bacterium]MBP3607932.1 hypothetical protein [Treponema sp.]
MYINATLKISDSKNVGTLLKKFFERIKPENSISIDDGVIELKYYFEEYIPGGMLEAIGSQEIISFSFNSTHHNLNTEEKEVESLVKSTTKKNLFDGKTEESLPMDKSLVQQKIEEIRKVATSTNINIDEKSLSSEKESDKQDKEDSIDTKTSESAPSDTCSSEPSESLSSSNTLSDISLENLAKQASSYEEFVDSIVKLMDLSSKEEFFRTCIEAADSIPKVTWKNLEEYCNKKGISFGLYEKQKCTRKVAEIFGHENISILLLFKKIVEYKNNNFASKSDESKKSSSENNVVEDGNISKEQNVPQKAEKHVLAEPVKRFAKKVNNGANKNADKSFNSVSKKNFVPNKPNAPVIMSLMMKCMPEIKYFEDILKNIDMTKPVENRVRYVLTSMGLLDFDAEMQKKILELAVTAVNIKNPTLDAIFMKTNIEFEEVMEVRANFGKLINNFVAKSVPDMKVKMLDFLKDLQNVVMMPYEIVG